MNIDLSKPIKNFKKKKPGVPGRYSAGDVYAIIQGWLTPEQFITGNRPPFMDELTDNCNMLNGIYAHEKVQSLLPQYKHESKIVYEYKGITIVGKFDTDTGEEIWDYKTSRELVDIAKPLAISQLRIYLTIFERPIGRIYEPRERSKKVFFCHKWRDKILRVWLEEIGEVKRNDACVFKQLEKVVEFDKQVKLCQIKQ